MPDLFDAIPAAFAPSAGPPMPDWPAVGEWVSSRATEDPQQLWTRLAREWLLRIAAWRPAGLRLDSHGDFLLLSALEPRGSSACLKFMQHCRDQLCRAFPNLVLREFYGPFAAIIFRDTGEYYDYVAEFDPEGEWGGSGGTYINQGYGHVVTYESPAWALRHVLAHEIVHAHFVHRTLPLWLEEGLTQTATDLLTETNTLRLDRETVRNQRTYWSEHGLQRFWCGEAFFLPDEGQKHAYLLAHVLFKRELEDRRRDFLLFLEQASAEDYGAAAAEQYLGRTLDHLAAEFLGPELLGRRSSES